MNIKKLTEAGIDYDEGLHRFAGNEQIYEKFLKKAFDGMIMEKLNGEIENKDYEKAVKTAHELKGITGNLSMNSLYEKLALLVNELRDQCRSEVIEEEFSQAQIAYEIVKAAIKE